MLGSFMDDIGITADQFEAACRLSAGDLAGLPSYFHKRLFEQIWAANDYEMFVKMMTHKNVELQLQALELIEQRYGTMPSLFSMDQEDLDTSNSDESIDWPDNDDVMTEIKKLQLQDFDDKDEIITVAPEEVVAEKQTLLSKLHTFEMKDEKEKLKPIAVEKLQKNTQPMPPPQKIQVSEEEVRARQEYLKQQRDKLLALKKQVRERRLDAVENVEESRDGESSQRSVSRPRSARVAQAVLKGSAPAPPSDAMQLRRALASKLKSEVVESSH
ncbi:cilia- and flagella-associated protein 36 isoform X2 [Epargyreus clarus]